MAIGKWLLALALAAALGPGFAASGARAASIIDDWANVKAPPAPPLKTVTVDPKTTALLLLDFVKPICNRYPRCVAAVPTVKKLLDAARANKVMVVYSGIPKVPVSEVMTQLAAAGGDPYVQSWPNKFLSTDLEKILKDRGIKTVIVTGVSAVGAVLATASDATQRGFDVILPVDGMAAQDLYSEQYAVWHLTHAPIISKHVTLTDVGMIKF